MSSARAVLSSLATLTGCAGAPVPTIPPPTPAEQVAPVPPVDTKLLDLEAAVEEALAQGGLVTAAGAWAGHVGAMADGALDCPIPWAGTPPDDVVDIQVLGDADEDDGFTWVASCTTPLGTSFEGFAWWTATTDGVAGSRALVMDGTVTDPAGTVLFDFDGSASDALDTAAGTYTSDLSGLVNGALVGLGSGLRAQNAANEDSAGGFEATWGDDGALAFFGAVEVFDGFGPPDGRDPSQAPELEDADGWTPGMPRFTSIRFEMEFRSDCAQEPYGYVGLRGNEGFWFDVYFLPLHDPAADEDGDGLPDGESADSNAYPYEQIDNVVCDGVGTVFARNIDLQAEDEADPSWSREVAPDFAGVAMALPTPSLEDFVYTLRNLTE